MSAIQILGALEMGLIYSFVALGVYISFRTLQFPDMTVDGSFPLGAAVAATAITKGLSPGTATLLAVLAGSLAGWITAWLSTRLRVLNLLAGILTMTALYSINLRVMGKPNVPLIGELTLFQTLLAPLSDLGSILIPLLCLLMVVLAMLYIFLNTEKGLALRATGINPKMARAQGIFDHGMIFLGLSLANGLIAFSGALFAQVQGFADITLGVGTIIFGLASVILGESLFNIRTVGHALLACVLGSIVYWTVMAMALNMSGWGIQTSDRNLVTALLVTGAILLPSLKKRWIRGDKA